MTRRTFYRKLASVGNKFTWEVTPFGCLRGESKEGERFCPITAVYFATTGNIESSFDYDTVGNRLKLEESDSEYLAREADTVKIQTPGSRALLRAVGLA